MWDSGNGKGGMAEPLWPVKITLYVKRRAESEEVGVKVRKTIVDQVTPGSPASLAGLVRTMRIEKVCGTPVSSPEDMQAASTNTPCNMALEVTVDSSARLRGTVAKWMSGGFGSLSPDVPVFVPSGLLGVPGAMYTGDIFCHKTAISNGPRSLALGQEVEFNVKVVGGKLKCFSITGVGRPLQPYVEAGAVPVGVRMSTHAQGESICMLYFGGVCSSVEAVCPRRGRRCAKGLHLDNPHETELKNTNTCGVTHNIQNTQQDGKEFDFVQDTLSCVGPAKLKLLQKQVEEASRGGVRVCEAWRLRNDAIEFRFRATEYNMTHVEMKAPDMIDGFHGTAEENVLSIAQSGFDPLRRSGQMHGEGEYFARDPCVSVDYCRGGGFMFVCKLILGTADVDHTWVSDLEYYIIKQRNGNVQCLPQYLIRFQDKGHTPLYRALSAFASDEKAGEESMRRLGEGQRGGVKPCKGHVDGCMMAELTSHIWLGWLDPSLGGDEAALHADLCAFLSGYTVKKVHGDRNGARFGAFVELEQCVNRAQLAELNMRPYGKGAHRISVDDAQPGNPYKKQTRCPKLIGEGKYCRGWNLRGHRSWFEACSFFHKPSAFIHSGACVHYQEMPSWSAKYHELEEGMRGVGRVLGIWRVINTTQEVTYDTRRSFFQSKHGDVLEMDLWHGTECSVLHTVMKRGLQSPADSCPSDACWLSGGKGLSTTLCGTDCELCTEHHKWNMCHMFGLGIYLADDAAKSHRYVRPHGGTHSLVRCRVNLGNPFLIESNLKQRDAMHDITWCVDPSEHLEEAPHVWDTLKGHDSYYVKGLGHRAKPELGVINSEYIVFHPAQVLPLYIVDYVPHSYPP